LVALISLHEKHVMGAAEDNDFPYWHRIMPSYQKMFQNLINDNLTMRKDPGEYEAILERKFPRDYIKSDGLSNHFTEDVRMYCKFGQYPSPMEVWRNKQNKIRRKAKKIKGMKRISALREAINSLTCECNTFNPAFGLYLMRELAGKMKKDNQSVRIMDPSAGWGDRCIAACAFGAACYHGYDPNTLLQNGYNQIIDNFSPTQDYWVKAIPFEDALIQKESYDIVLTSPPFFDLEKYPGQGGKTAQQLSTYNKWLEFFYKSYLENAWKCVRLGGYFVLYISDIRNAPLATDSELIIKSFGNATDPIMYGLNNIWGRTSKVRPAYVWQKKSI